MTQVEIIQGLLDILSEMDIEIGSIEDHEDINLLEYINDSFTFMNFVIGIEENFNMDVPEDLLSFEAIESLRGLANRLQELI